MQTFINVCLTTLLLVQAAVQPSAADVLLDFVPLYPDVDSIFQPYDMLDLLAASVRDVSFLADHLTPVKPDPNATASDHHQAKPTTKTSVRGNAVHLSLHPQVSWVETTDGFVLTAATPGLPKPALKVDVVDVAGSAFIELSHNASSSSPPSPSDAVDAPARAPTLAAAYSSFRRRVRLPRAADRDSLRATYRDGLLVVTLTKSTEHQAARRAVAIE